MRTEELAAFIREREAIRTRREAGLPAPWTDDPILRTYRFCCVRREHDAVSRWITESWLLPNAGDPDLWFAMLVARHLNLPASLEAVGYPVPWNRSHFQRVMAERSEAGLKSFNAAYMIRSRSGSKAEYLAHHIFDLMWMARETLRPRPGDTLNSWHMMLCMYEGIGTFMGAQVVADMKHVAPLSEASDWWTFAASGPGSRRGLNRVLGLPADSPWTEDRWRLALGRLSEAMVPLLDRDGVGRLCAQNLQNCLCEFDKMERARTGEGRPKQLFRAGAGLSASSLVASEDPAG